MTETLEYELDIPVEKLRSNPDNPRMEIGDVTELSQSIKDLGLLEAILVHPDPLREGIYVIEAGERRWVAMKPWAKTIRCHVRPLRDGEHPAKRNLVVGLVENGQRKNLNPIERAKAYERLQREFKMTMEQIADTVKISPSSVSNSLLLLDLAPKAQQAVVEGKLTVKDATTIVRAHRSKQRVARGGSKTAGAQWDSALFTRQWPLARRAETMCNELNHGDRRKVRGFACEHCIDKVIRLDEANVRRIDQENNGLAVTFQSPGYQGSVPNGNAVFKP